MSGLLMASVVLAMVALLGMKVAPAVIEYLQIVKAVKKVAGDGGVTVAQVKIGFDKQANIDNIKVINSSDLEISKEGGRLVISFAYENRIPLFGNATLLLDFQGSSED